MGVMTNSWAWLPAPTAKGQVGGHEGVGTVAKFGPGTESSGLKLGDRVGFGPPFSLSPSLKAAP